MGYVLVVLMGYLLGSSNMALYLTKLKKSIPGPEAPAIWGHPTP